MQELTSLDLSHNRLLEATEVDLAPLRKLRKLDLSYNSLQSVVLPGDCSHLVDINFDSNALTSLPSMPNMRSLRWGQVQCWCSSFFVGEGMNHFTNTSSESSHSGII